MKSNKIMKQEERYNTLIKFLRSALNTKTFNGVNMQEICKMAGVDASAPTRMVTHGYLIRERKGSYKATEALYTVSGPEMLALFNGRPLLPSPPVHPEQAALDLIPKINVDVIHPINALLAESNVPYVMEWEKVPTKEKADEDVMRAKVPGGWLVKSYFCAPYPETITQEPNSAAASVTMNWLPQHALVFLPDPAHVWTL